MHGLSKFLSDAWGRGKARRVEVRVKKLFFSDFPQNLRTFYYLFM